MKNVKWQVTNYHDTGLLFGPVWQWPEPLFKIAQRLSWANHPVYKKGIAREGEGPTTWYDAPEEEDIANIVADYIIKNRAKLIESVRRRKTTVMKRVQALQEEENMLTPVAVVAPFPEEVVKEAA